MKKGFLSVVLLLAISGRSAAQIDINKIVSLNQIIGKVLNVKKGFAPKFALANVSIPKITRVAEIIGLKRNEQAIKLFNTFKTGRTIYRIASYAGAAIAAYSAVRAIDKSALKEDYQKPLIGALSAIGSGLIVKFITKGASYKAVDIFNGIVTKKIKDILGVGPASSTMGVALYVKL